MSAGQYLYQADGKCQFAITENKLDQFNNKNFIFGQLFLRHFYTVYNFENEQISLGINRASADMVRMMSHSAWLHQGTGGYAYQTAANEPQVVEAEAKVEQHAKDSLANKIFEASKKPAGDKVEKAEKKQPEEEAQENKEE